jgi:hypothetical protein
MADRLACLGGDPGGDGGRRSTGSRRSTCRRLPGFETWLVNAKVVKRLPGLAALSRAWRPCSSSAPSTSPSSANGPVGRGLRAAATSVLSVRGLDPDAQAVVASVTPAVPITGGRRRSISSRTDPMTAAGRLHNLDGLQARARVINNRHWILCSRHSLFGSQLSKCCATNADRLSNESRHQ